MSKKHAIYHGTCLKKQGITMVHVQKNMLFTMVHVKTGYYRGTCLKKQGITMVHVQKCGITMVHV